MIRNREFHTIKRYTICICVDNNNIDAGEVEYMLHQC